MIRFKKYHSTLSNKEATNAEDPINPLENNEYYIPNYVHGSHANGEMKDDHSDDVGDVQEASMEDYNKRDKYRIGNIVDTSDKLSQHYDNVYDSGPLRQYTTDSKRLNSYLVSNHRDEAALPKDVKEDAEHLSKSIAAKPAPFDFHVHSGLGFDPSKHMSPSGKLVSPAFLSTSLSPSTAASFAVKGDDGGVRHIMRIKIPKDSHHGSFVEHVSQNTGEHEFIINKGTTLKVNKKPLKLYNEEGKHTHSIWHATPTNDSYHNPHYDKQVPADKHQHHEYMSKLISGSNSTIANDVIDEHGHNLSPHHVDLLLHHKDPDVRLKAVEGVPHLTPHHIDNALNDSSSMIRGAAIRHKNASAGNISKALKDSSSYIREQAASHPKATAEHINKALDDVDGDVRWQAISHPNATAEHINKALDDPLEYVRHKAIRHPNATADHISKALNDVNSGVREGAMYHPNVTADHITQAIESKDRDLGYAAFTTHPHLITSKHLDKALDHDTPYSVKSMALDHPKISLNHLKKAASDPNERISARAQQLINTKYNKG